MTETKNLLFLLAAAPMATGCIITTDDTNDSNGDETGDPTTTGDGDGDATTTGDGDGDPTTTGDGDGDATTTGDGDGDPATGDGDGDPGLCGEYASKYVECYGAEYYAEALQYCQQYTQEFGSVSPECLSAFEAYLACLSALTCEEFGADNPCPTEVEALEAECVLPEVHTLGLRHK